MAVRLGGFAPGGVTQSTVVQGVASACSAAHRASAAVFVCTRTRRAGSSPNWTRPLAWGAPFSPKQTSAAVQTTRPGAWAAIHPSAKPSAAALSPGAAGTISISGVAAALVS